MKDVLRTLFILSGIVAGLAVAFLVKESVSIARGAMPNALALGKVSYMEDVEKKGDPVEIEEEKEDVIQEEVSAYSKKSLDGISKGGKVMASGLSARYKKIEHEYSFPKVTSASYVVADIDTGDIIAYRYPDKVYPIASLSKLMTALVSFETLDFSNVVKVSRDAVSTYGAAGGLSAGDSMTVWQILHPLLLASSNDAAEAIAESVGRDNFMKNMNKKAKSLGLKNTSFDDPSGLSENNISTSKELFDLTKYIYDKHPEILEITSEKKFEFDDWTWYNHSRFRNDENYIGGKNGFTDYAQHTLISVFELPLGERGETRNIAVVLLNGHKTENDMRSIVAYLNKNIEYVK